LSAEYESHDLLPPFAATYPVDFFSLLDCAMHPGMTQADATEAINLLHSAILTCQLPALLQQQDAVLSLALAVTSLIKACTMQCAEAAGSSAGVDGAEAAGVSAGLHVAVLPVVHMLHCLAYKLATVPAPPQPAVGPAGPGKSVSSSSSSSSSSSASSVSNDSGGATGSLRTSEAEAQQQQQQQQQHATSKVLLAVLLARSLVVLADVADPAAVSRAVLQHAADGSATAVTASSSSSSSSSNAGSGIQQSASGAEAVDEPSAFADWQDTVIEIVPAVHNTLRLHGLGPAVQPCSSRCSTSSSATTEHACWGYLLQLLRSKKLADACDEFACTVLRCRAVIKSTDETESNPAQADDQAAAGGATAAAAAAGSRRQAKDEMCSGALQFCRVLAGAAPLPHLCNNLGCSSLAAGGTEAAAAVKVCSGCGAWYCSAGCAAAHWRQHKKACRRMAALRLNVNA
jgi:hypothetical protein